MDPRFSLVWLQGGDSSPVLALCSARRRRADGVSVRARVDGNLMSVAVFLRGPALPLFQQRSQVRTVLA
jgi:hypothetical protein